MNQFYITHLTLRNFKCYEKISLPLKKGVNILYGTNGTGKTTLLEALCIAAGSYLMRFSSVEKRLIKPQDIRLKRLNDNRYPTYQFPVEVIAKGQFGEKQIEWKRSLNSIKGGTTSIYAKSMDTISDKAYKDMQGGGNNILPLIVYFSTGRLFDERKKSKIYADGRAIGYYNALNATNTRKHIQAWFAKAEFLQYQRRQTDASFTDEALLLLKRLLLDSFKGDWEDIYYYEPEESDLNPLEEGLFIVKKDDNVITERLLSDGQRNFMWLIAEIGWRTCMLNPSLGKDTFKQTQGIVLIDEIDLHLHPQWQQTILSTLSEAFPALQFVVTTHSPILISSIKANVLKLENNEITTQPKLYGMKAADILQEYMNTTQRLPHIAALIESYFTLINLDKYASQEAKDLRQELERLLPSHDILFTEADALIEFLKL